MLFPTLPDGKSFRHGSSYSRLVGQKAFFVLRILQLAFLCIIARLWDVGVLEHNTRQEKALRPQKRIITQETQRGAILDRNGIPLAVNRIDYKLCLHYGTVLQSIPNKVARKKYIDDLAAVLSIELESQKSTIEDEIYGRAALLPNLPHPFEHKLTEKQFYRLKAVEKDFPGLIVTTASKRFYPLGKVAGDILGYLGPINRAEYEKVIHEIAQLEALQEALFRGQDVAFPPGIESNAQLSARLKTLQEKAYSIRDVIGKSGLERNYEDILKGFRGKTAYLSDAKGRLLQQIGAASPPVSGQTIRLTLSSELQAYAEELLAHNERLRDGRSIQLDMSRGTTRYLPQPWIKGGAIVAIDPRSGEILALASYPRFDPNDFLESDPKKRNINVNRWLETQETIKDIWERKTPLIRENFSPEKGVFEEESEFLTFANFLKYILPKDHVVALALLKTSLRDAFDICENFESLYAPFSSSLSARAFLKALDEKSSSWMSEEELLSLFQNPSYTRVRQAFLPFQSHYDQLLYLDLLRLWIDTSRFSLDLAADLPSLSLAQYADDTATWRLCETFIEEKARELFSTEHFQPWKQEHGKVFLKEMRHIEQSQGLYSRSYLDYFLRKEQEMFKAFWSAARWDFTQAFFTGVIDANKPHTHSFASLGNANFKIAALSQLPPSLHSDYLKSLRQFRDFKRPLYGRYGQLRTYNGRLNEKSLASAFYPTWGFGYGRSFAFRQATTQGSIFKFVTAYTALNERYNTLRPQSEKELNPLVIDDYPHRQENNPSQWNVGYRLDGTAIEQYYKGGRLPRSARKNYGRIDLIGAIATSSNPYFALLAADHIQDPKSLAKTAYALGYGHKTGIDLPGELSGKIPQDLETNRSGLYSMTMGQHSLVVTPLQTSVMLSTLANGNARIQPHLFSKKNISQEPFEPLPRLVRNMLLKGMGAVLYSERGRANFLRLRREGDLLDTRRLFAKTSTSESLERVTLDELTGRDTYKHIWGGAVVFPQSQQAAIAGKEDFAAPELVVVVFLRFGDFGREALPLCAKMAAKWMEIKSELP